MYFILFSLPASYMHFLFLALQRIQSGILKAFNNPTTKTADEDTRRKVKGTLLYK